MRSEALLLAGIAALGNAQSTFNPLRPPSLPLAVRSPYMSTWQAAGSDGGNGGYLAGQWPTFHSGGITGWAGYIRVDNITYIWLGDPVVPDETNYYVTQTDYTYTATRSIFTMDVAGVVGMTITMTSPVLPDTILEMSLPYTYMDVQVNSIDGKEHDVQLYTDISAEWVAGDRSATAQWSYGTTDASDAPKEFGPVSSPTWPASTAATTYATRTAYSHQASVSHPAPPPVAAGQGHHYAGIKAPPFQAAKNHSDAPLVTNSETGGIAYHKVWRQQQLQFAEFASQAEWGYWYYATANVKELTYQSAQDIKVRANFINNGFLPDTESTNYRGIDDDYPVFGFALDLGKVTKKKQNALFQLSLHQQNCIQFEAAAGDESVPCMWTNYFDSDTAALSYFYNEYTSILSECESFDSQIKTDSDKVDTSDGKNYYSLTALAVRQAFGALEYTNTPTQPWVFLKEISSDGNVQTVDVIFPFHPIAIYTNATILRYMLDPLFINQEAGWWPYQFSIHDLGDSFPNATGHNNGNDEMQPVEECGNMIIMALAYAQRTGDDAYLAEHYDLLKQWNDYLVSDSLIPAYQLSTDDFLGEIVNNTNLALKGMIGIEAMAQIANRTGHTEDGLNYTTIAHDYIEKWYDWAMCYNCTPEHEQFQYNNDSTWGLLYNLYADRELGTQLVKQEIYDIQSRFYPTVFQEYGVPLHNIGVDDGTKTDWELFCAAIASESTKNQFISIIAEWLNETPTNRPFTDFYNVATGNFGEDEFYARPVIGAMFTLLALESAPTSPYVSPVSL